MHNPNSQLQTPSTSSFNFGDFSNKFGDTSGYHVDHASDFSRKGSSARSRPRLMKLRRQIGSQHVRSRACTSVEFGLDSGSNPFREVSNGASVLSRDTFSNSDDIGNVGFVFGDRQISMNMNLDGKKTFDESVRNNFCESVKLDGWNVNESVNVVENLGFVFGAQKDSPEPKYCGHRIEPVSYSEEAFSDDNGKQRIDPKSKGPEIAEEGFVFGSRLSGISLNTDMEKRECGEFVSRLGSNDGETMEFLKKGNSGENPSENMFSENRNSSETPGIFLYDGQRDMKVDNKTEFQQVKAAAIRGDADGRSSSSVDCDLGTFAFGISSNVDFNLNNCTNKNMAANSRDGVNLKSECVGGNYRIPANSPTTNFGSDVNLEGKYESRKNLTNVFRTDMVSELPDKIKKLNIYDPVYGDGVGKSSNTNKEPFSNGDIGFSYERPANQSGGCSHETMEANSVSHFSKSPVDIEATRGDDSESRALNDFASGDSCNAADASGISFPGPFIFQAGVNGCSGCTKSSVASATSPFSSFNLNFQPTFAAEVCVDDVKKNNTNCSTDPADESGVSSMGFKTPQCNTFSLKESLFNKVHEESVFTANNKSIKDKVSRKTKGRLKKPFGKKVNGQDHAPNKGNSHGNLESPRSFSPMDFSPYQETTVSNQNETETFAASKWTFYSGTNCEQRSQDVPITVTPKSEGFVAAGEGMDTNQSDGKFRELNKNTVYSGDTMGETCSNNGAGRVSSRTHSSSNMDKQENNSRADFPFTAGSENMNGESFRFLATSTLEGSLSAGKRRYRRKSKVISGHDSFVIAPSQSFKFESPSMQSLPPAGTSSLSDEGKKTEACAWFDQGHKKAETYETCEKWRIRGNQAYRNGDALKAEEFYTQGIISVPSSERLDCCLEPLLLCYSNRAAARISLGRIRDALEDCKMATTLDPSFLKAHIRAANCYLVLGEIENALVFFNKCLESEAGVCLDRRIRIDAAGGLQKAQKVAEFIEHSSKLLEERKHDSVLRALEISSKALSISSYSEKLLEMKAEALCMLRRFEEAVQLCEQSLCVAEKNFTSGNSVANVDGPMSDNSTFFRVWRWCLISKSYFYMGKLEAASSLLDKLMQVGSVKEKSKNLEASISLAATIRELLHQKNAGNEAFKSGKYKEAAEHYTLALSSSIDSRSFSAIIFCNRAAAHQALGQIADAIADCSLAIALDGSYAKAVSRRVTLHELIRDYGQAASDLRRFISILENQSSDTAKESSTSGRSAATVKELRKAQLRLPMLEEEAKKGASLDFYLILGCKPSDTASDLRKAYRKAALKHHPDKTGQFLARSDSVDEGLWKDISQEVQKDADRLFKMIGEAYAVLSDTDKRSQYDLEEELRRAPKESNGSSPYRKHSDVHSSGGSSYHRSDFHSSPYERSSYRRNYRDSWKTYGNTYSR